MHQRPGRLAEEEGFGPFVADRVVAEPTPKRVRALVGGEAVLDSTRAMLAWIQGPTPDYAVPAEDAPGLADDGAEVDHERLGRVHPVALDRAGGQEPAGVRVVDPPASAPGLRDHVVLDWDAVDEWYVEDDRQLAHPRDPYRRIDVHPTSREVVVELEDARLATSTRALAVVETGLPVRFYLPREDVRTELVEDSDTVTRCAYKGQARYYDAHGRGTDVPDAAWSYPEPEDEVGRLAERIAFHQERVTVRVDGQDLGTPDTPWP
jgi:uncharacterized protein (DUF427 family)